MSGNPSIIRVSPNEYVHKDNLNFNIGLNRAAFGELVEYSARVLKKERHVSIKKIFSDTRIKCKSIGIRADEMLYSLFRIYASDTLWAAQYPQLRLAAADNQDRTIQTEVLDYLSKKNTFCTIRELEELFVKKLGYRLQTVDHIRYHENVYVYLKGALIHKSAIQWHQNKQDCLENIAANIYQGSIRKGLVFSTIIEIMESNELPELANDIQYSKHLIADLLTKRGHYIVIGSAYNAYVPTENEWK